MAKTNETNAKAETATNTPSTAPAAAPKKPIKPTAPEGFKLVNWTFGTRIDAGKFGIIDLTTLTPARAAKLVAQKFPYLEKA